MAGLNKVMLIGNLGQDPDLNYVNDGIEIVRLSVATNETFVDKAGNRKKIVEWNNVILWNELAIFANKYLKKGNLIYVEGRLKTRTFEKNNEKKHITEVIATKIEKL